jgi:hypothetical protein
MYTIHRNPDSDEQPTGLATPSVDSKATQTEPEGGTPAAETTEPAATELEDNDFNFDDPEGGSAASPSGGSKPSTPSAAAPSEETVSRKEYELLAGKFQEAAQLIEQLKAKLENPLMKAVSEYEEVLGAGVEINPSDFVRNYFGVEADHLGAEDLIRLQIQDEARQAGIQMTEDDFERTFDKRFNSFDDKDDLAKAVEIKRLKEERKKAAKALQDKLIADKLEDQRKGQKFWEDTYTQGVLPILSELKENKKKTFGLVDEITDDKLLAINTSLANNFYRFKADKSLDIKHAIEVAHFASDIKSYVAKIEERAVAKFKLKNLKDGAPGVGLPSSASQGANKDKTISSNPGDITSLQGATVVKMN